MKKRTPFSKLTLTNADECSIYEARAIDLMRAGFQMALHDSNNQVGMVAYILEQIITINGKNATLDYIFDLSIEDYNSIMNVVEVSLKKIKL